MVLEKITANVTKKSQFSSLRRHKKLVLLNKKNSSEDSRSFMGPTTNQPGFEPHRCPGKNDIDDDSSIIYRSCGKNISNDPLPKFQER